MARFIVLKGEGKALFYQTSGRQTEVGRSEEMDLVLTDVSVSRHHARITVDKARVQIEDLGSQNGLQINGERLPSRATHKLRPGDEILLGEFTLLMVKPGERFYKGRFIEYMTVYSPNATESSDQSTYKLSSAEISALYRKRALIQHARVQLAKNENMFWHPEDRTLTIGKKAMVTVGGILTGPIDAEIIWAEGWHELKKVGGLAKVYVNEKAIRTHRLRNGDQFKVGNTQFVYLEHDPRASTPSVE